MMHYLARLGHKCRVKWEFCGRFANLEGDVPTRRFCEMFQPEHFAQCSGWNIRANVPVGTLERMFRLEH
jgi:hypothetical protein